MPAALPLRIASLLIAMATNGRNARSKGGDRLGVGLSEASTGSIKVPRPVAAPAMGETNDGPRCCADNACRREVAGGAADVEPQALRSGP